MIPTKKIIQTSTAAALIFGSLHCPSCQASGEETRPAYTWINKDWNIRYVIFVGNEDSMRDRMHAVHGENLAREQGKRNSVYLFYEELFDLTSTFKVAGQESLGVLLLAFDKTGLVTTANVHSVQLTGKLTEIDALVLLVNGNGDRLNRPFYFADWRQVPGADYISPAVCAGDDQGRYGPRWQATFHYSGNFGCREWTAQLYDQDRPYIDVTSYQDRHVYIAEHVGWSRFGDPPKPVIGRHGKVWLCLHECPAGEQPGIIPDIKKWAAKHGFPLPKRPARQPEFPNSNWPDAIYE
ncbi:hypothetical protein [Pseudoduganella aquatica]|uniref:Uncharacterized protein n=1 Tax=Pseudoduganella aquatica TaxID=2660641 RepID=A0A7X4KKB1_9BURK|nr:hypothetical protein [Pseudoduganella aquatica]MYN06954.1 hypothetical protein [Pseudoduganella aquatica]